LRIIKGLPLCFP